MHKFLLTIIIIGLSFNAYAANTDTIAIVDVNKVMREAKAAKSVREQLKAKQKQYQEELKKQEAILKKKDKELTEQKQVLSDEEFKKKLNDFKARTIKIQRDIRTKKASLDKAFNTALNTVRSELLTIINDLAKKNNYTMVMPKSQLLNYRGNLDISTQILNELNRKLPALKLNF